MGHILHGFMTKEKNVVLPLRISRKIVQYSCVLSFIFTHKRGYQKLVLFISQILSILIHVNSIRYLCLWYLASLSTIFQVYSGISLDIHHIGLDPTVEDSDALLAVIGNVDLVSRVGLFPLRLLSGWDGCCNS
jgi:hypothetical protein